uniref:Uncharacterized protein n=1 Tax=Panagrolaimus davidi TaxID=227884 RepID=A0A914QQC6_9BILA
MRNKFYNFYYPPAKSLNYENFWRTKIIQDFSLPNPLINYIILNPTKYSNSYQKLLESCKYFYGKKAFLMVQQMIHVNSTKWFFKHPWASKIKAYANPKFGEDGFDVLKLNEKLWILKNLHIESNDSPNAASLLTPKIYRCDVKILELRTQKLSLNEFKIFCQNVEKCILRESFVTDEKGHIEIPFETVLESMPNLIKLDM